MLGENFVVLY